MFIEDDCRSNDKGLLRMRELRKETRDTVVGQGDLTWDDGGASRYIPVDVSNISENGVQLIVPRRIAVGTPAFLTGEEFRCIGTVRYCASDGSLFLVGLEFNRKPHYKNGVAGR